MQVFKTFSLAEPLVKKRNGNDLGDSLIIGLPTMWEGREVVAAAGKLWTDS